jgi:hypothetical protein
MREKLDEANDLADKPGTDPASQWELRKFRLTPLDRDDLLATCWRTYSPASEDAGCSTTSTPTTQVST